MLTLRARSLANPSKGNPNELRREIASPSDPYTDNPRPLAKSRTRSARFAHHLSVRANDDVADLDES